MKKLRLITLSVLATGVLFAVAVPALAQHSRSTASITVTEGKPAVFSLSLSASTVAHGTVTFNVKNVGVLPHDFTINGKKTPQLAAGKSATLVVTFAKAGKYPYSCTLPGHAAGGMKGTLTVT